MLHRGTKEISIIPSMLIFDHPFQEMIFSSSIEPPPTVKNKATVIPAASQMIFDEGEGMYVKISIS